MDRGDDKVSTQELVKKVLEDNRARVYCQTCGLVFLDIPLKDYVSLTRHNRLPPAPDHWYVLTGIHWCEHPDHQMVAELPAPVSVNQMWDNKMALDNQTRAERGDPPTSREIMLPHLLRYDEETGLLPI